MNDICSWSRSHYQLVQIHSSSSWACLTNERTLIHAVSSNEAAGNRPRKAAPVCEAKQLCKIAEVEISKLDTTPKWHTRSMMRTWGNVIRNHSLTATYPVHGLTMDISPTLSYRGLVKAFPPVNVAKSAIRGCNTVRCNILSRKECTYHKHEVSPGHERCQEPSTSYHRTLMVGLLYAQSLEPLLDCPVLRTLERVQA